MLLQFLLRILNSKRRPALTSKISHDGVTRTQGPASKHYYE